MKTCDRFPLIAAVVAILAVFILPISPCEATAQADSNNELSLTTLFACNNTAAGSMFDVQAAEMLTITRFETNLAAAGSTNTVEIYYRLGTSVGHESSSAGWSLLGTAADVISNGENVPTPINIGPVALVPGQVYGFYVNVIGGSLKYTDGTAAKFSNAQMTLTTNCGKGPLAFSGNTFFSRRWNGTVYYILASSYGLFVSPSDGLNSFGPPRGPFNPNKKTYTLTNNGSNSLSWTAAADVNWLTITPAAGTLDAGASSDVDVLIDADANALPASTRADTVTFTDISTGAWLTRNVTLAIKPRNQLPEITPGKAPAFAPIHHMPYYLHERELFGYNPRFPVNSVEFDFDNRPYIRGDDGVYTLSDDGEWIKFEFVTLLKSRFPTWNGTWGSVGPVSDDRIVFDDSEEAYVVANLSGVGLVLMYSRDKCRTWQTYLLPGDILEVRMEYRAGHNELIRPPVLLARTSPGGGSVGNQLKLIVPTKNTSNNTLTIPTAYKVTTLNVVGGGLNCGKGASCLTATKGTKTHIVFAGADFYDSYTPGTPAYAVTFDFNTKAMTSSYYLGSAGDPAVTAPDGHNWPAIVMDSGGYLHVILAAHGSAGGQCFKYRKSLVSNSTTGGWSVTENFVKGLTYPSLLCDPFDSLQLVARDYWEPEMRLKHQRRLSTQTYWDPTRHVLVIPWDAGWFTRAPYSHYAAKFSQDQLGRLFIVYYNDRNLNKGVVDEYNPTQFDEFNAKYPCDGGVDDRWHDPAMQVSDDHGITWRLAVTQDFIDGIIR